MPLTLPTHPVAVLPLKLWRPRWFDGVALTIGAIAPDIAYAADGYGIAIHSHAWHAPLWWALPVTLLLVPLVRWAAPTVAAHLPGFRDYGVLNAVRHRWYVTAGSTVLGAVSHIVWDAFTHPRVDGGRILFPALHHEVAADRPWWHVLSQASDLLGFVAGAAVIIHIGRKGLLRRWHGSPPPTSSRPAAFWSAVAVVAAAGLITLPLHPIRYFHDQAIRVMLVIGLALLAGALTVRIVRP
jgi:hypothetical protein